MADKAPCGVVGILTSADGHVMASATDFERQGYGGFSLQEAQRIRVKNALGRELVRNLCHPDIPKAMDSYECQSLLDRLTRNHGYSATYIPIGHKPEQD